jgi:hypothetical protein
VSVNGDSIETMQAMFNNDEPLHPDLVPYLDENGPFGPALWHPLVHEPFHHFTSMTNRAYLTKQRMLQRAINESDWSTVVFLHERPYRLDALWQHADLLPDSEFWSLAGQVWIDSENIWQKDRLWRAILRQPRPAHENFMDPADWEAFDALPETLTVARGCIVGLNEHGLSWTTDAETAKWFAHRFADHKGTPTVRMRTVQKSEVFAYLGGRGESEIILRP